MVPNFFPATAASPDPVDTKLQDAADYSPGTSTGHLSMTGSSISELADRLSAELGCKVIDKTGLKGNYDFNLQWQA